MSRNRRSAGPRSVLDLLPPDLAEFTPGQWPGTDDAARRAAWSRARLAWVRARGLALELCREQTRKTLGPGARHLYPGLFGDESAESAEPAVMVAARFSEAPHDDEPGGPLR